jgi:hypothetical protein
MRNPVLAQAIDIRLSLSDWLTLCGWMSAHMTEATSGLVTRNIQEIGNQVVAKARNVGASDGV